MRKYYIDNLNDIDKLKNELINLKYENVGLKNKVNFTFILENELKDAKEKINTLQLKNEQLIKDHNEEIRKYKLDLEKLLIEKDFQQMNYNKRMILFEQKMGVIHHIEMENEVYKNEINDIKEKNKKLEESVKAKIEELDIKNEIKFDELQKKVDKDLKEAKKNILTLNLEHMDINSKLVLFQNHKLLSQIEYQKQEIDSIIKENKELKLRIINLEKEKDINEKVKYKLANKLNNKSMNFFNKPNSGINKDLFNITKDYTININKENKILNNRSIQFDKRDTKKKLNKNNIIKLKKNYLIDNSNPLINENYQSPKRFSKTNIIKYNTEKINKINNFEDNLNKENNLRSISFEQSYKDDKNDNSLSKNKLEENIYLIKRQNQLINEKNYEINSLKFKLDRLKNKISFYKDKYKRIYDFLEESLNNFFTDVELKEKNFSINIENIKKFNFENFSMEEKYGLLILLMDHLLPLILFNFNSNCNIGNNIFTTNINIVDNKFNKRNNFLNDTTLKKAFLGKNNKLQKELYMKNFIFSNGSIPILRKKDFSLDNKFKDDKYKLLIE